MFKRLSARRCPCARPSLLRHLRRKPLPNRLLQKHRPSLLLQKLLLPNQQRKLPQPNLRQNRLRENRLLPAPQNQLLKPRLPNQPLPDLPLQKPPLPNQQWPKPLPLNRLQNQQLNRPQNQQQNRPLNQPPGPLRRNLPPSRLQNPSLQNQRQNLPQKRLPNPRLNPLQNQP